MDISKSIKDKLFLEKESYPHLMKQLATVDSFKGQWKELSFSQSRHLKELRKIATISSIGSSTRIEGAALTDQEVEQLLSSVKISKLTTRDEQEVVGYWDVLQLILDNYQDIDITQRYIHQLHGMLLKHSGKDQSHKGKFKTLSNQVIANYPDGSQKLIFRTTDPHMTPKEMEDLLLWVAEEQEASQQHPVLVCAGFAYEFLSIHPYQDGNGRLSRLLTTLLLLKSGYDFVQYVSLEHIIEERKEDYYRSLMEGQKHRYSAEEKIDRWVLFFVDCLVELIDRLEIKYETYNKLAKALNDRQKRVLEVVKTQKVVAISDVEQALEGESRNTLKKDLSYLVDEGLIVKSGERKGTRYHSK